MTTKNDNLIPFPSLRTQDAGVTRQCGYGGCGPIEAPEELIAPRQLPCIQPGQAKRHPGRFKQRSPRIIPMPLTPTLSLAKQAA